MSQIARRERIEKTTTEPTLDGGYIEREFNGFAWACLGCGLVWTRQRYARDCEQRGHAVTFEDGPYGVTHVENGHLMGNVHYFTRRAMRRERQGDAGSTPTEPARPAAPQPSTPVTRPVAASRTMRDRDDDAYDAWLAHVAAHPNPVPAWNGLGIKPRLIDKFGPGAQRLWARSTARRMMAEPQDVADAAADRAIERQHSAEPPTPPTDAAPYHGWHEWESLDGWGVCNILANGGFNVRGIHLKGGPYTRAQAAEVARRLNAGDPEAFKLLTQRRFR